MLKHEFERLAMRGDATISNEGFETVNRLYMSDNDYHRYNGGIDELKTDFVQRVFGGKVNTEKTIALKLCAENIRDCHFAVGRYNEAENQRMARIIIEHECFNVAGGNMNKAYKLIEYVNKNLLSVSYNYYEGRKNEFVYMGNEKAGE